MAFLCPVRIKRSKKKKATEENVNTEPAASMGRITGSASIETLVRVGIEKENGFGPDSKMVVLHDFIPCVDDELEVKRGQIVHVLYQENDWVYVISENEMEGFIPHSYCAPFGSQLATLALNVKKKLPRDFSSLPPDPGQGQPPGTVGNSNNNNNVPAPGNPQPRSLNATEPFGKIKHIGSGNNDLADPDRPPKIPSNHNNNNNSVKPPSLAPKSEVTPFNKSSSGGSYVVLYTYLAQDENDLTVERGQIVTLLNSEDSDWYWVSRFDTQEGFVPSGYIYPLDAIHRHYGFNKSNPGNTRHQPPPPKKSSPLLSTPSYPVPSSISNAPQNQTGVPSKSDSHSLGSSSLQHFTSENSRDGSLNESVPIPSGSSGAGSIVSNGNNTDIRHHGTELIMLYDYKAQAPDDLTVKRGDWVYADMTNQTVDGWLWTYAVKSQRYGFIPKAYARPPASTNL